MPSLQFYRFCGLVAAALLLVLFIAGFTHMRYFRCEQRRLAVISALNSRTSNTELISQGARIEYSPEDLSFLLYDPLSYEEFLFKNIAENKLQVTIVNSGSSQVIYINQSIILHKVDVFKDKNDPVSIASDKENTKSETEVILSDNVRV